MENNRIINFISRNVFWIFISTVIAIILFAPIRIPSDISVTGKIFPARQWVLFAGSNGQIMNTQIDLVAGISHIYETREFSRGDDVRFEVNPEILHKNIIRKNDTVGVIYSYETQTQLNTARMQLEVEKALLRAYQSGEKIEAIELAEKRLDFAKTDAEIQRREFNRQKKLYEQEVITDQQYENQQRSLKLKDLQSEIIEAELKSLSAGEKPEQIEYIKAQIEKISSDIRDLEDKLELQTIYAPLTGNFRNSFSSDTLMIIESMDEMIIKMPVSLKDREKVYLGQRTRCTIEGQKQHFNAEVIHISNHVAIMGGKQTFIVTARIMDEAPVLLPGVVFRGKLEGGKIMLRDFVGKWFRIFKA